MKLSIKIPLFILMLFFFSSCQKEMYHSPKREFRGVWLTTLQNLDFPSSDTLTVEQQKTELRNILDYHQKLGVNAIIFQVRAMSDAMYPSKTEPWAACITSKSDSVPDGFYDPLAFIIEETKVRNMELHAWFNPYRVIANLAKDSVSHRHISVRKPEWVLTYGNAQQLDPALPEVRNYVKDVIMEVVQNYDIDAVHFDDYFYPYPLKNKPFNDETSFEKYGRNFKNKADWRRNNTDLLIQLIAENIQKVKPHVKFGISPFGIWRNESEDKYNGTKTTSFSTSYDYLYADVLKWLREGWIDYVAPQVYWSIGYEYASYDVLVPWWSKNSHNRHLYIGQAIYKIKNNGDKNWENTKQIPQQIRMNRAYQTEGQIFFRSQFLTDKHPFLSDSLRQNFFKYPALPPTMDWKDSTPPQKPQTLKIFLEQNNIVLSWEKPKIAKDGNLPSYYAIYRFPKGVKVDLENMKYLIQRQKARNFIDTKPLKNATYVITALDRLHNESQGVRKKWTGK